MNHWTLSDDPQAEREANNYDKPVPSREYLLERLEAHGKPLTHENMSRLLGLEDEDQQEAVRRRLNAMERDGQLDRNKSGGFTLIDKSNLIEGRVVGHRDGIGFLVRKDRVKPDLVIPPRQMRRVFDGDEVLARVSGRDRRGRDEATIVEVLARNTQTMVGIYRQSDPTQGVLVPENSRIIQEILIPAGAENGAKDGQVVAVRITQQPATRIQPSGEVVEVLGERMDPGMEIDIAIREHDIPADFPPEVDAQIAGMSAEVLEEDKAARVDLRNQPLVTIDGEDAKDFDDAVYAWKTKSGGWKLIVAIADVSHYVRVGAPLDQEAHQRGNSVYFPGQVVPMLPELLSNGLCSLNPDVDRLCMVCEMNISQKGEISRYKFYEAVMRSHARLTYTKVGAMLQEADSEEGQALREQYRDVLPALENLHGLYKVLRSARSARGAIDFETTETQIVFNEQRKIEKIVPRTRNDAHKLIEECMLAANVATARFLSKHELPSLYRVHQQPSPERLENLRIFLGELGLTLGGGEKPQPSDFQALRDAIKDRPDADIIQTVMLRTMSQAVYSPHNEGHFGLAYTAYAHFTSPIRRYPDLLVHRAIRSVIRSGQATNSVERLDDTPVEPATTWCPYSFEQMVELGEHCSMTERRADDATRDVEDWLKCEFMSDKVGEVFDGTIASVTQFGIFVRLDDYYVEGLVHITALPSDYYHFEPERHQLKGERGGLTYRLGDGVTVRVARVDLDERKIDFELAVAEPLSRRKVRRKKPGGELPSPAPSEQEPRGAKKRKSRPGRKERERLRQARATGDANVMSDAAVSISDTPVAQPRRRSKAGDVGVGRDDSPGGKGDAKAKKAGKPSKGKKVRKAKSAKSASAAKSTSKSSKPKK
ncbi:ribonuclease R [Phytohalomonas tamaricis]|uniref:ribonuclease R n=1 Tax=Phytohalomonas tamaricis TaxID=2081032 RepID=UPI000D0AFC0A|nr:ribonuclease R [Phytohalomonas tamaricis]